MHTVIVELPEASQVAPFIAYAASTFGARAYEVHQNRHDDFVALNDVARYYNGDFQQHEHVVELTGRGYSLVPWEDLPHDHRCEFADLVELYSEGPDYLSPALDEPMDLPNFIRVHQNWLEEPG